MSMADEFVLKLSCDNRPGIDAAVSCAIAETGGNVVEAHQFNDRNTGRFLMRVVFEAPAIKKAKHRRIVNERAVDVIVLARYMQILSDQLAIRLYGRVLNIHHSFLPSFKGAKPYHQAHRRGVKLIGTTAHYVTPDLDEGPIIEQEVARVKHSDTADDLVRIGRDTESRVLARAVEWHLDHRVFLDGDKTVVFA